VAKYEPTDESAIRSSAPPAATPHNRFGDRMPIASSWMLSDGSNPSGIAAVFIDRSAIGKPVGDGFTGAWSNPAGRRSLALGPVPAGGGVEVRWIGDA